MDIDNIIKSRRSYFPTQFSGEEVDDRIIQRILQNANWAPSHLHTEPWRFKVYKKNGLKRLMHFLADTYKQITPVDQFSPGKMEKYYKRAELVSHIIVIVMKRHNYPNLPETEEISAVSCAVQNMWLTLSTVDNTGGTWLTGPLIYSDDLHHFLELDETEKCLGLFYIGTIRPDAPQPKGNRRSVSDKVTWVIE